MLALSFGIAIMCGALVLAFDRKEQRTDAATTPLLSEQAPTPTPVQHAGHRIRFEKCGRVRSNCVVDGDTLWLNGVKIRIADIDTPEISRPKCQAEYELGLRATQRLIELLNEDEFSLAAMNKWGDQDRYGRKLRLVVRNGESIGELLIREGLAHRWDGSKKSWC